MWGFDPYLKACWLRASRGWGLSKFLRIPRGEGLGALFLSWMRIVGSLSLRLSAWKIPRRRAGCLKHQRMKSSCLGILFGALLFHFLFHYHSLNYGGRKVLDARVRLQTWPA